MTVYKTRQHKFLINAIAQRDIIFIKYSGNSNIKLHKIICTCLRWFRLTVIEIIRKVTLFVNSSPRPVRDTQETHHLLERAS